MNAFTLSDMFWNVSVLNGGSQGVFPSQLPVMQSNIPVRSAKRFLMALKSIRCCLEITYPTSASAQLCQCCGGFLLSYEGDRVCYCNSLFTASRDATAGATSLWWLPGTGVSLGAITKEDDHPKLIWPVREAFPSFHMCFMSPHDLQECECTKEGGFLRAGEKVHIVTWGCACLNPQKGEKKSG